jgi:hypothetical protein
LSLTIFVADFLHGAITHRCEKTSFLTRHGGCTMPPQLPPIELGQGKQPGSDPQTGPMGLEVVMSKSKLTYRVSLKGAISVYGLGRFPITLYPEQWSTLMGEQALASFVASNQAACEEQAKRYDAACAVADAKGISGDKERDEYIRKLLGFAPQAKAKPTVGEDPARAKLIAELMAKAV